MEQCSMLLSIASFFTAAWHPQQQVQEQHSTQMQSHSWKAWP
jgi:hypothetical protein